MKVFQFSELSNCDLIIDAVYEGGNRGNVGDDPINKILPVGNQGGFRYAGSLDDLKYLVLYTSGENIDWPDNINSETGVFQYYGDNKKPGHELHDTVKKGNYTLKKLFDSLYSSTSPRKNIPPIFIFKKHPTKNSNRSVQFKGLCVPGTIYKGQLEDLIAIWKTTKGLRFQNYLSFFTILDIASVSRAWIEDLNKGNTNSINEPKIFKKWKINGTYTPLISPRTINIRSENEQLPENELGWKLLEYIHEYFADNPTLFEYLAAELYRMTDSNIIIDKVTRGSIDGGRDAIGRIKLGVDSDPIYAEFAIEAKCYNPGRKKNKSTVGVREVSRLISRIKNRQFGIMITTSSVARQVYKEVREDNHPIIFLSGRDIVKILINNGINTIATLKDYLQENYPKY
jgi:hypothetical protein